MNGRSAISSAILIPGAILVLVIGVFVLLSGLGSLGFRGLTERQVEQVTRQATERMRLAVLDVLDIPRSRLRGPIRTPAPHRRRIHRSDDSLRDRSDAGVSRARRGDLPALRRHDVGGAGGRRRRHQGRHPSPGGRRNLHRVLVSSNGRLEEPPLKTFLYVPSTRPYHVTAMNAGPGDWTPLYLWASADAVPATGVGFVRRVRSDDGTPLGIVGVECTSVASPKRWGGSRSRRTRG